MAISMIPAIFVEVSILYAIFNNISKVNFSKMKALLIISILLFTAFITIQILGVSDKASFIINVLFVFVLAVSAYIKWKNLFFSIFLASSSNIISLLSGSIASATSYYIAQIMFEFYYLRDITLNNWWFFLSHIAIIFFVSFILSRKAGNILHQKTYYLGQSDTRALSIFLAIISNIVLVIIYAIMFFWAGVIATFFANAITIVVIFMLFTLIIFAINKSAKKDAELRIANETLNSLKDYVVKVENVATEVRKFRHDHYNLLLGFNELIKTNDINGINAYYQQYMSTFEMEIISLSNQEFDKLSKISHPVIKGLISAKLSYAQQLGVNIQVDTSNEINILDSTHVVDICRVIGIILDNAVEACLETKGSELFIGVSETYENIHFIIKNTYNGASLPLDKIHEKGFSTKGNHRGTGLHSALEIIRKSDILILEITIENGNVVQILTILNER